MHLTRPKSSKGRNRPAVNSNSSMYAGEAGSIQRPPSSPVCSRPDRNLRSRSQPTMWPPGQLSQDQVFHILRHAPAAPPQSLNKYKVLPSIERRRSEVSPGTSLDKNMSRLSLSDDTVTQTCRSEGDLRVWPKRPDAAPKAAEEARGSGSLLLAVRAPCGRRFQQHFDPTDTLHTVRSSAEVRYGDRYGEAFIETMDVPRRTFTDLDMTLAQCGIVNRSVLCISQNNDSEVEHE
ncbi:UBX domain-containing protein 10 [Amphiprion ocellaris]|uniref:UBX domain-containing protein n=1 Tax=Amphiprion ocellaris TaxID=80972 RepID=A0A3Q1CWU1_AMPOC|nr:UBX domain-containing protein 10 [Amphiprion ocellaris]